MKEWIWWLQDAQHEWWFIPGALAILALVIGTYFGIRIAYSRIVGRIMSPRLTLADDQVEKEWATPVDLEKFGLIQPAKKKWFRK